jgi:hypothetical protein
MDKAAIFLVGSSEAWVLLATAGMAREDERKRGKSKEVIEGAAKEELYILKIFFVSVATNQISE